MSGKFDNFRAAASAHARKLRRMRQEKQAGTPPAEVVPVDSTTAKVSPRVNPYTRLLGKLRSDIAARTPPPDANDER